MVTENFDYSQIPAGFYDDVMHHGSPVRRAWHQLKFERIVECIPASTKSVLDIGCFGGTFLSILDSAKFPRQLGVDILADQIKYASAKYGSANREFRHCPDFDHMSDLAESFDVVTLIEVIEHLRPDEIAKLFSNIKQGVLKQKGMLILSTPNYTSAWPLLEFFLNRVSNVKYEEQHLTKFNYFNFEKKICAIVPEFDKYFRVSFKTTTHFLTPFLAVFGVGRAAALSRMVNHKRWKFPFGSLLVVGIERQTPTSQNIK